MPTTTSASATAAPSLLDRARALMQRGQLAAAPLAAAAAAVQLAAPPAHAQVRVDYSTVTTYSNSGFLTSLFIDDSAASGTATGTTAALTGNRTITDSLFWRFDNNQNKTVPRYDTTGIAFIWGGALSPTAASEGDSLTAHANFTINFTHTQANPYDDPSINYQLMVGYGSTPYTIDYEYIQNPYYTADYYISTYNGFDGSPLTSPLTLDQTLAYDFSGGESVNYWFVQLNLNWENEYVSPSYWSDNYSKLNGDLFQALGTVSVNYESLSAVPEPATTALAFGAVAGLALAWRRRSRPAV